MLRYCHHAFTNFSLLYVALIYIIYGLPPLPPTSPGLDGLMTGPGKLARLGRGWLARRLKGVKSPAVGPTRRLAILEAC